MDDSIGIDAYDIKKLTDTNNDSYERLKQTMESLSKGLFSSMAESNLSAWNQLSETVKESFGKWGSIYAKYDYSAAFKSIAGELSQLSKISLGYDTETIRNSIGNMVESLSVLQTEQLKQIANIDYSKAFSSTYASIDSLWGIINMAYTASQEYDENEMDELEPEDDILTAEEAMETICEHIDNPAGFVERISTWSQEKIKKYWIIVALFTVLWNIFVLPYLQENIGKPAMATFTSNVKELPEKGAAIVCQLKENIEVYITENTNYYYKVSFTDENGVEREGYVAKRNLRIIQEEIEEKKDDDLFKEESLSDTP